MRSVDRLLEFRVNRVIDSCLAEKLQMPPVDLHEIARRSAVLEIEERWMVPEAVLTPEGNGFRIYLQSNFNDFPGTHVRRRFSLAHEIAHTFFYELRNGIQKSIKGAPRGEALEFACHEGASLLLVPPRVLNRELRHIRGAIGAERTIDLARKFDVSTEVMLRRLSEVRAFDATDTAVVLVRRSSNGAAVIQCAAFPPWLRSILPSPERGMAFVSWIQNAGQSDRDLGLLFDTGIERQVPLGTLRVSPYRVTRSQHLFELRM